MERREMLGLVGAGAAGLWTAGAMGAVDDEKDKKKHDDHHGKEGDKHHHEGGKHEDHHGKEGDKHHHDDWEHRPDHDHMKTVGECAGICNATMAHCVEKLKEEGGKNREIHAKAVVFTNDCQAFCVHHVVLMARHSPLSHYATQACADACRDCAKVCDEGDDEVMKKCAQVCRDCEKACREHLEKCEKKG